MKKSILTIVALAFMATSAMAQDDASNGEKQERKFDQTEMIKKRTEGTAKKYGLSEEQTAKLLELNQKYASSMPGPRMRRGRPGDGPRPERDSVNRPKPTEDMKAKMDERRKKMEEDMAAYNKELQTIMTEEQYKSYQADMQKRMLQGPRRNDER